MQGKALPLLPPWKWRAMSNTDSLTHDQRNCTHFQALHNNADTLRLPARTSERCRPTVVALPLLQLHALSFNEVNLRVRQRNARVRGDKDGEDANNESCRECETHLPACFKLQSQCE